MSPQCLYNEFFFLTVLVHWDSTTMSRLLEINHYYLHLLSWCAFFLRSPATCMIFFPPASCNEAPHFMTSCYIFVNIVSFKFYGKIRTNVKILLLVFIIKIKCHNYIYIICICVYTHIGLLFQKYNFILLFFKYHAHSKLST